MASTVIPAVKDMLRRFRSSAATCPDFGRRPLRVASWQLPQTTAVVSFPTLSNTITIYLSLADRPRDRERDSHVGQGFRASERRYSMPANLEDSFSVSCQAPQLPASSAEEGQASPERDHQHAEKKPPKALGPKIFPLVPESVPLSDFQNARPL